jgi:nucleotide-binding universal stress UspA family protein
MPIRTILAVTGADHGSADILGVAETAEAVGAHLNALVVASVPQPPVGDFFGQAYSTWSLMWRDENERVEGRTGELRRHLAEHGRSGDVQAIYCIDSEIDRQVGIRARYADLCMVGPRMLGDRALSRRVLDGLLFSSPVPVLLLPQGVKANLAPKSLVVAWNARFEASAALHKAMEIILGATDVRIVLVDPEATQNGAGEEPGADVAAFLARHGVTTTIDVLSSGGREPGLVLQQHARNCGADLIVMGAYGHSRLRERLLGGTTQWMVENADIPVLMSR